MSLEHCQRLLISLADSLEDLKIRINNEIYNWNPQVLKSMVAKDEGLIQVAHTLLRLLADVIDNPSPTTTFQFSDSWEQLLSNPPEYVPLIFDRNENESSDQSVSDQSKLEYLHILATTLQQRRLCKLKEPQPSDNVEYPLNLLGDKASEDQKNLLMEGYSFLLEDYENRRRGMQQRFRVLLETNFDNPTLGDLKPNTPSQLNPSEDLTWLVKHFTTPHSSRRDIVKSKAVVTVKSKIEDPVVDRGGRTDSEPRWVMPEWQSERLETSNTGQPMSNKGQLTPKQEDGPKDKRSQAEEESHGEAGEVYEAVVDEGAVVATKKSRVKEKQTKKDEAVEG